jgi:ABC-type Fe3+ transport system permease subunit
MRDGLEALELLGFTWPTPAYIVGAIVFGLIGLVAYYAGKRRQRNLTRWLGLALMLYPYVVPGTVALWTVGVALSGLAWYGWRE